jgi:hypothetical protein
MTATIILAAIAFASTVVTVAVPMWRGRRTGPDSTAVILTASATYFNSLHDRLSELEARVAFLEAENRAYFVEHGPLPKTQTVKIRWHSLGLLPLTQTR